MQGEPAAPAPPEPDQATYLVTNVPREVADYWQAQPSDRRHALDQSLVSLMTALAAPMPSRSATADNPEAWAQLKLEASAWRAAFQGWHEVEIGWLACDFQRPIHEALASGLGGIEQAFVVGTAATGDLESLRIIDLVVIGTVEYQELAGRLVGVERMLQRKVIVHLYNPNEWSDLCNPRTGVAEWLAAGLKFHLWPEVKVQW